MLGGGIFVTQNKTLPGSYLNFVNASSASSAVGDRGVVAIPLQISADTSTGVHEITRDNLATSDVAIANNKAVREILLHANKVLVVDTGSAHLDATKVVEVLEAYEFNVLCAYTSEAADITTYVNAVKSWRDELGKKCQVVVYNQDKPNHEGVINVVSTVNDSGADTFALTAWVAGAEAGCKINESCTNMLYDGEYDIKVDKSQEQLEDCITNGQIVFHRVYGDIRLLEDVNSLTTTTDDKGEDFKYNQTIRVIDQVANDIAKLFNTKYLGRIPNNPSGRVSLWADIVAHHRQLEAINAIEAFDATLLKVEQGNNKKSVVVSDVITVTNAMAQLYMTVVIQ